MQRSLRYAPVVLTLFAVIICVSPLVLAQTTPRLLQLIDKLEPYLSLVERYRIGGHEQAILSLSGYSQEVVETGFKAWQELVSDQTTGFDALANQRPDLARARHPRTLESAALLHAVSGMVAQDRGTVPGLHFHLGVARAFIRLRDTRQSKAVGRVREVSPTPSDEEAAARQSFDADWSRAVAVFLHGRWAIEEAKPYMESAMMLPHVDANRLFDAGRLFEASHAARTMQLNHRYDPTSQSPSVLKQRMIDLAGANADLRRAEALLREAIASGGAQSAAARLRLGRVLYLAGQSKEATDELQSAIKQAQDSSTVYLGELFLGRLAEQQGKVEDAISWYEAANRRRPRNQSGRMALAHLLALSGRSEEARTLVTAILTTNRERHDEPWWLYHHPDEDTLSRIVAEIQERLQ